MLDESWFLGVNRACHLRLPTCTHTRAPLRACVSRGEVRKCAGAGRGSFCRAAPVRVFKGPFVSTLGALRRDALGGKGFLSPPKDRSSARTEKQNTASIGASKGRDAAAHRSQTALSSDHRSKRVPDYATQLPGLQPLLDVIIQKYPLSESQPWSRRTDHTHLSIDTHVSPPETVSPPPTQVPYPPLF